MFRPTVRVMRRLLVLSIALLPAGLPGPAVAGDEGQAWWRSPARATVPELVR